jgi:hypothetical protein
MNGSKAALERVRELTADQVRDFIIRRLMGEDTVPVGSGYFDEPAEDIVIELLRSADLDLAKRAAVVTGCRYVYGKVANWLLSTDDYQRPPELVAALLRVSSAADAGRCADLADHTAAILQFVIGKPVIGRDVAVAAVTAALAHVQPGAGWQAPLWEAVLDRPDTAAYGLTALLRIDPYAPRIERALMALWLHQIADAWLVDSAFLTRSAARARGSDAIIFSVLTELKQETQLLADGRTVWGGIESELARRKWTRAWLDELARRGKSPAPISDIVSAEIKLDTNLRALGVYANAPSLGWSALVHEVAHIALPGTTGLQLDNGPFWPAREPITLGVDALHYSDAPPAILRIEYSAQEGLIDKAARYHQQMTFYTEPRDFAARSLINSALGRFLDFYDIHPAPQTLWVSATLS